jgi:hypothetical protein
LLCFALLPYNTGCASREAFCEALPGSDW